MTIDEIARRIRDADRETSEALRHAIAAPRPNTFADLAQALTDERNELDVCIRAVLRLEDEARAEKRSEPELRARAGEFERPPPRTFSSTAAGYVAEHRRYGGGAEPFSGPTSWQERERLMREGKNPRAKR